MHCTEWSPGADQGRGGAIQNLVRQGTWFQIDLFVLCLVLGSHVEANC